MKFKQKFRLNPDDAKAYFNRGMAKQDFQTALQLAIKADDAEQKTKAEKALRIINE